jgi:hypothetical protein
MPLVAGHQVVGARGIGAFQELVVVRVLGDMDRPGRSDTVRMTADKLEELLAESLADFQLGAREYLSVFGKDGIGDVEACRLRDGKNEDGALEAIGLQRRRITTLVSSTSRSGIIRAWVFQRGRI